MTHPGIEAIGVSILDAVTDGAVQFKAIAAVQRRYPAAAATMMMDLTVEAEAFGAAIHFSRNALPSVTGRLLGDRTQVDALPVPSLDCARVPQYLKAARLSVENITDRPFFAGCIGPFSLAARLFGLSELMMALCLDPETVQALVEKCAAYLLDYVRALKNLGAAGVIMAEPAAGLISAEHCDAFSSAYIKPIVDAVQDERFLLVLHNCGNRGAATRSMLSTGAGGLHFGNAIDLVPVLEQSPAHILIMGNLDPVGIFRMSGPEQVLAAARTLLQRASQWRNFVISSGCDLPPGVPPENLDAFFQAVAQQPVPA